MEQGQQTLECAHTEPGSNGNTHVGGARGCLIQFHLQVGTGRIESRSQFEQARSAVIILVGRRVLYEGCPTAGEVDSFPDMASKDGEGIVVNRSNKAVILLNALGICIDGIANFLVGGQAFDLRLH